MVDLLEFLKEKLSGGESVERIVDVFEKMCDIPLDIDAVLFETGVFPSCGKDMFLFSLTRQFPNDTDDEFYQLRVEICYEPDSENSGMKECIWSMHTDENIFDIVRRSPAYEYARCHEYLSYEISLDET